MASLFTKLFKLIQTLLGIPLIRWVFWNLVRYVLSNKMTVDFVVEHKKSILKEMKKMLNLINSQDEEVAHILRAEIRDLGRQLSEMAR